MQIKPIVSFTFIGFTFVVRRNEKTGSPEYRDADHLGGKWSDAIRSLSNNSLHLTFRRELRKAIDRLNNG